MKTAFRTLTQRSGSPSWLLPVGVLFLCLCISLAASAQTVEDKGNAAALQMKVHLKLGETTLAKALQEMSKQTGLQIQPADYLQDRELLVELDNMTAKDVLDTLAEANDWTWYETKPGQISMARPKFTKTQQLLNIAPAFRAIVPKDIRHFVGVDLSDAEIRSVFRQSQPNSNYISGNPGRIDHLSARDIVLPAMLVGVVNEQERLIAAWVTAEVKTGKKIPYAKLTPEQQHTLLTYFVLKAMSTAFGHSAANSRNLIFGIDPAMLDESQIRISYKNGTIFTGMLKGGRLWFGEGIMSERQLPDPLFLHTPL